MCFRDQTSQSKSFIEFCFPNLGVPYTLSDNRNTHNYLAFSGITGNSKQDFTFTKKSKFEFTRT